MLWKQTSKRPGDLSYTLEALGPFQEILVLCQQIGSGDLYSPSAYIWLRELDFDRKDS